jgi:hypothetical protein
VQSELSDGLPEANRLCRVPADLKRGWLTVAGKTTGAGDWTGRKLVVSCLPGIQVIPAASAELLRRKEAEASDRLMECSCPKPRAKPALQTPRRLGQGRERVGVGKCEGARGDKCDMR